MRRSPSTWSWGPAHWTYSTCCAASWVCRGTGWSSGTSTAPRPGGAARGRRLRVLAGLRRAVPRPPRHRLADAGGGPALAEAGYGDRLLLGGDTVVAGARSVDGGPGMPYLLRRVRSRLTEAVGAGLVDRILMEHPGRAFAVDWK
ncbi:hypothetical protein O1M54_44030 [Streptomyces diastatochromogenes]|nr:hypothetical protein [Streptomyces diastatochromogenes]